MAATVHRSTLEMPSDLALRIHAAASAQGMSDAAYIRQAVERAIDNACKSDPVTAALVKRMLQP